MDKRNVTFPRLVPSASFLPGNGCGSPLAHPEDCAVDALVLPGA